MSYGVNFIMAYLEKRLGKRIARQIVYLLLMVFGVEKKIIKQVYGASDTTLAKYSKALKDEALEVGWLAAFPVTGNACAEKPRGLTVCRRQTGTKCHFCEAKA